MGNDTTIGLERALTDRIAYCFVEEDDEGCLTYPLSRQRIAKFESGFFVLPLLGSILRYTNTISSGAHRAHLELSCK
jgi:hypothetical protein